MLKLSKSLYKITNYREKLINTEEIFDPPHLITENINKILAILEKSKNPILLTGAGVSTSSGIPDYRSSF